MDDAWAIGGPLVYVYEVTIRPGIVKGWIKHDHQDAACRRCCALYDDRDDSPTRGLVSDMCFDDHTRSLVRIPAGVWHAIGNVRDRRRAVHQLPDGVRTTTAPGQVDLPLDTDKSPFRWSCSATRRRPASCGRSSPTPGGPALIAGDASVVTVVIATYNCSSVLRHAIQHLRARPTSSFELLRRRRRLHHMIEPCGCSI